MVEITITPLFSRRGFTYSEMFSGSMILPLWRRVAILALPVALQVFLQSLLGMADVAMVSGLGEQAVAAVGLAAKLHFLLLVLMIGVATGGSILIAQYSGAGQTWGCQRTLAITLLTGGILSLPFMLAFALSYPWLALINPDATVVDLASRYLVVTALVLILTQSIVIYEAGLRATGKTAMPLVAAAIAVVLNVFLNYVFIFGKFGFTAMGVEGAAWGTLIARFLQLAMILMWLYGRKHPFAMRVEQLKQAWQWQPIKRFMVFSLPLVMNHAIWGLGNSVYHIATGFAGTDALAVMGVMVPLESAFFALFIGLANACAVMVGHTLGASQSDEAWRLHRIFDRLAVGIVITLSGFLWLGRPWILTLFNQLDEAATHLLMNTLTIFCLGVWIKISNMVRIIGVLRAGGDNKFCLITDTIVMWFVGLPIFIAAIWLNAPFLVLYALMFLEDALKFVPVKMRINRQYWMKDLTYIEPSDTATVAKGHL